MADAVDSKSQDLRLTWDYVKPPNTTLYGMTRGFSGYVPPCPPELLG